ncbi:MAG: cupredoxin domain-containing protein [Nanoarchaeota archaeon]
MEKQELSEKEQELEEDDEAQEQESEEESQEKESDSEKTEETDKESSIPNIKWVAAIIGAVLVILIATQFIGAVTALVTVQNNPYQQPAAGWAAQNRAQNAAQPSAGGVTEVQVSFKGYQYQPNPIRLKQGVPARLVVDLSTVRGCMRSIQIPSLGVSKRVSEGNNIIEFTPTKAGTFRMQCAMGMGQGVVIVEDNSGAVPAAVNDLAQAPTPSAGSCGAGGGGCGCGGG